jgi:GNAT superfamily N-acetyltransferase
LSRPGTGIEIRAATAADATAVHGLIRELARTTGLPHKFRGKVDDYLAYGFGDKPMFEALVATQDGDVVGVALYFFTFSSWRGEPGIYLQDLVVTEAARGSRLGKRLMQHLVLVARERGATHLRLAVDSDNTAAMRFYERCGMSNVESDCIFEIEGEPFERLGSLS